MFPRKSILLKQAIFVEEIDAVVEGAGAKAGGQNTGSTSFDACRAFEYLPCLSATMPPHLRNGSVVGDIEQL